MNCLYSLITSLADRFVVRKQPVFDLTAWLSRSAEVNAFDVTRHIRDIDARSRGSLATAFAIRVTRPLAMEAVS